MKSILSKFTSKIFGGINLTWPRLIIFSIIAGVYTAIMALLPAAEYTSFYTICVTYEVWVFFGIFIIMNSKSNLDAALKCFVFFLISQPLVYLIQVPFSELGWGLFGYYKFWFIMTLACFPMGFIGYFIKKGKWYGYFILLPMILLTLLCYRTYLSYFTFDSPRYILISLFCAIMPVVYPLAILKNKIIKYIAAGISVALVVIISVYVFAHPFVYSFEILGNIDGEEITDSYKAELEDDKYGNVSIIYIESVEGYMVHGDFTHSGNVKLFVTLPSGVVKTYELDICRDTYSVKKLN